VQVQRRAEPALDFLDFALDLEPALVHVATAVAPMGFVIELSGSVAVSDGDAIDDRLDPSALCNSIENWRILAAFCALVR